MMTDAPCAECGMPCRPGEYHPYAACLMFKACRSSKTVRENLDFVMEHGAALAQPAGDAVAWVRMNDAGTGTTAVTDNPYYRDLWASEGSEVRPLYTAPPVAAGDARDAVNLAMVIRGARALCRINAEACNVDFDDKWALYSEEYKAEANAMLKAALTQEQPNG